MIFTEYRKKRIKDISIATFCIIIGAIFGIISLFLFYFLNLAIFGFNIGLILSPLIAGYVETLLAWKIYKKTTGAVSAFILFIVTVFYGFIYINTGLGFNIISIGSAAIILQAAIPTLVNYFLIVVILGIFSYILGIFKRLINPIIILLKKLYFKLIGKEYIDEKGIMDYNEEKSRININKLEVSFYSTTKPGREIEKIMGVFEGKILIKSQKKLFSSNSLEKKDILLANIKKARQQALINLNEIAKEEGCDAIIDLAIEFDTLGGLTEDNIHIVARGTGVKLKEIG
ncbi:MAG: heavy metal-binding domain-containing protein [Methanobrevibacter sp.]|nr:heavy metal-binding domain-containing protein [Methanobrevibacter sp.]